MKLKYFRYIFLVWCTLSVVYLGAQQEIDCDPTANLPITQGEVNFNYGSVTNSFSFRNRSSYTVAQSIVGNGVAKDFSAQSGFWARFLLPPQAPDVQSSQGDFPDRVLIKWNLDPLSSEASNGYVVTRDGAFLSQVDKGISQFIDFNVQAGEFYEYKVYGRNQFGNGTEGKSIGFINPNGVVTGKVETLTGNPVAGAIVSLSPSIGTSMSFDGIDDYLCVTYKSVMPTNMFTASAWIKIGATHDSDGVLDLGSDLNKNFWIKTTPAGLGKGVVIGVGDGTSAHEITHEYLSSPDGWHNVGMVYAGGSLLLYIDGAYVKSMQASIVNEAALFSIGSNRNQTGFFDGIIDDVKIYNRPLNGTEMFVTRNVTVSKNSPGLVAYWKFDEGIGTKVFDISDNNMDGYIRGATFSDITPSIQTAGITDEAGFYSLEGINYSKKQSFTAKPSKIFYSNYSLEFNSAYQAYATLTDFDLPDTSTVEIIIHPFDIQSRQTVLSKGASDFELWIESGFLNLTINGQSQVIGPVSNEYRHLSFNIDGRTNEVKYYNNGLLVNTFSYASVTGSWLGTPWTLASKISAPNYYYTGLIDEVTFYKSILSQSEIQLNASNVGSGGTNTGHPNLMSYFSLNEATGTELEDFGPAMTGFGQMVNAFFSIISYKQSETPHLFRPSERLVNINPSNTAATGIDFVDESTLTVSGVIRFSNTFCYQDSVEILVNGQSAIPQIFTNEEGEFVADFEPGVTVTLTPKFADHNFFPPFYQVRRLNRPIAGVLFQNTTKRVVTGVVTGGLCGKSVIPDDGLSYAVINVEALNLCYSKNDTIYNTNGKYTISEIPPIPVVVKLIHHSTPAIKAYFVNQGAPEVDLRKKLRDTTNFVYIAPPQVYIQPFMENGCAGSGLKLIDQSSPKNNYKEYSRNIRVFEQYDGGVCYLDSFKLTIENNIADLAADTVRVNDTTTYLYKFWAGQPNLGYPHNKFLQVTAEVNGSLATAVETVVVLGERSRESTFTTASPAMPLIILRDPPGDKSNAVLAKGNKHCQTWSDGFLIDNTTSLKTKFDLGPTITTYSGSPFGGVITQTNVQNNEVITGQAIEKVGEKNALEVCTTAEKEYSTSSDDAVIGGGADVYVGAAINYEFSATDVLSYDPLNCSGGTSASNFPITQNVRVNPKGFGTNYIYSEWQIETDVIPSLEFIGDTTSANSWRNIILMNKNLKGDAIYKENISFDAFTNYTETVGSTSSRSTEFSWDLGWTAEYNTTLGFDVMGVGTKVTIGHKIAGNHDKSEGSNSETSRTVKFTLGDSDIGDNFTLDVLDDPVFGTPVFKLKAGESMCPWEPGTLNREEVEFNIDRLTAPDIPENEPAVFKVKMTNKGQTGNDFLVYLLGKVPGSNPDAAYMQLDGAEFGSPMPVQLGPFQTKDFLISVYRGPVEYNYNNIGIFMASACQMEHSQNLGYALSGAYSAPNTPMQGQYKTADLNKFYKEFRLNVYFTEPCSPIDIGYPLQDWVITPNDNELLNIELNSYIYDDPDLKFIRVQYRRTGGDGVWINIDSISKADLAPHPIFKTVFWDMSQLADGPLEIRAVTQCNDVGLPPGTSETIKGRLETKPPELFGKPQPADGVLSADDEISISFTKRINCNLVFQADGIGSNINYNNLALLDMTEGGILIKSLISCKDDKIIIVPDIQNEFIENHVLRVVVDSIQDLYGNLTDEIVWEFYVNRSNLYWSGGDIDEVVIEGNELTVTREIRNQSGERTLFNIPNIPDWMEVYPNEGTLGQGEIQPVKFIFPSNLVNGVYSTVLQMETIDGLEPLQVDLRVACPAPEWAVNSADYSFSMNITAQLNVEGILSTDRLDRVGAFVNGHLQGIGSVKYNRDLDKHLLFLTVYSNNATGDTISFQIWDASECLLYGSTVETFDFIADGLIGSPLVPQVLHTQGELLRKTYLHPGWNWISYNVSLTNSNVNPALSSLTNPIGALIKNQTSFSTYSDSLNSWVGSMPTLTHLTMYQYNGQAYDSLSFLGFAIDPTTPIPMVAGWNWIGYLPQSGLPVTSALASLAPLNGDIIKSQTEFAQYVAGVGWVGNLLFLNSPNGYQVKLANSGVLTYPDPGSAIIGDPVFKRDAKQTMTFADHLKTDLYLTNEQSKSPNHWSVVAQNYEFNMNVIAIVSADMVSNMLDQGDEVAAFAGNEIRGVGKPIFIPQMNAYMVFLTIYANREGELITFKFFDASDGTVKDVIENTAFRINTILGQVDQPQFLNLQRISGTDGADKTSHVLVLYPNPAGYYVYINFTAKENENIIIQVNNAFGLVVKTIDQIVNQGQNVLEWKPDKSVPNGSYFVTLISKVGTITKKVELLR